MRGRRGFSPLWYTRWRCEVRGSSLAHVLTQHAARTATPCAVERAIAALRTALAAALVQCRARVAQTSTGATPSPILVEALLAACDEAGMALSDDELLGNVFTLVVAGTETTANTLAWMMHFLTDHPAVQRALQQEADAVLGEARLLPAFQAHERLRYSEAMAYETLRLKSVAPVLSMASGGPLRA